MKYKSKLLGDITKVLMGLVSRADTVSNSHLKKDPNLNAKKGDGIYVLSKKELKSLNLTEIEFKEYVKPFYKNSDITRYYSKKNNSLYLLYIKDTGYSINLPLSLKQHFIKFKHLLTELKRNFLKNEIAAPFVRRWLEQGNYFVLFNPKKEEYFDFEKIVCPYRSKKNSFAYNNQPWYASQDVGYILPESKEFLIKYILAILNSKLCFHWLYLKGKRKGETLELYVAPLKQIPIKICDLRIQYKIENYVDKILEIKNNNPHSDTSSIEKELDILIYRLYDLTFDEVKVIDPDFNLNEQEYEAIKL